jgi:hypothetical protein
VHLVFGSPGGRPTAAQVTESLGELGVDAQGVGLDPDQQFGFTRMVGIDEDGPLWIKVIGRDEADARFFTKVWRFVMYKDSGPRLAWTRQDDVEREAYVTLLARDAIARVRTELELTGIAAAFVGPTFTLAELRAVYEAVWGVQLDAANFRRRVVTEEGWVIPTGRRARPGRAGGRPAELYRAGRAWNHGGPIHR